MAVVTIIGAGMMGSALAFPARENGHEVRLVGTHLDREIIETSRATGRHPKFTKDFPAGVKYYQIEELMEELRSIAVKALSDCLNRNVREWNELKTTVKDKLSKHIYTKTKRSPMILPVIMNV